MGLDEGVVLNERQRMEMLERLRDIWAIVREQVVEINTMIDLLTKPRNLYNWRKDKTLSVNKPT